jgi:hypothetical protein
MKPVLPNFIFGATYRTRSGEPDCSPTAARYCSGGRMLLTRGKRDGFSRDDPGHEARNVSRLRDNRCPPNH